MHYTTDKKYANIYEKQTEKQGNVKLGESYFFPQQDKNRIEIGLILLMRTKGQTMGKHVSRNRNRLAPHSVGPLKKS